MTTTCERRLSQKKKCLGAWMTALLALSPAALSAAESVTSSAGGTGGTPYTIGCGTKAMVGVQGRTYDTGLPGVGRVVGVIQAICVGLNADGSWNGTPAAAPGIAGINRGTFVSLQCPQNQAVSGISGRSGNWVDQLRIHCAPLVEPGHLNGEGSLLAGLIGKHDTLMPLSSFGAFMCTSDKPGKGFTGKAGEWVDRVALVCDYPSVAAPVVNALSLNSHSVVGGTTVNGTVRLNANALSGGRSVNLSMSVPSAATFQSNPITVPSGTKTAPFVVNTNPVSSSVTNSISASPNTGSLSAAALAIQAPSLQSVSLSTTRTSPGGSVTGTVSLNGKAFSGGVAVNLTSSDTAAATVPAAVSILQNQTSAHFPVTVRSANQSGCSVISATYNQARQTVLLAVPTATAIKLSITQTSSNSVTATVRFPSSFNAARTLSLVSNKPATVSVPSSVTVPAGAQSANFTITIGGSLPVGANCAVVTAIYSAGNMASVILNIEGRSVSAIN